MASLAARATIVDVGGRPSDLLVTPAGSYIDLRGQTTLPELIAVIAAADLHVAPITGTVHIAAAMGVPAVVIYGGYEPPECTAYPGNIGFYSPVECAPCWLRRTLSLRQEVPEPDHTSAGRGRRGPALE